MISRWQIKSVAAFALLVGAVTFAQEIAAQVPTAYNEAAPGLRDAAVVVLDHIRVIDGTGAPAGEDQTLIVAGGRIRAVGDAGTVVVPPGAEVLDLAGHTVLPGLVIEVGKEADLLVVRGRPDERIEDLDDVRLVMANGIPSTRQG